MSFETLIQQVVSDNILTAVVSIFASLVVIIPIVLRTVGKINPKLEVVSRYGDTFGQKGAEITDDLYLLVDAIKHTTPEVEKYISEKYGKDLKYFEARAKTAEAQASRFKTKLGTEDPELLASSDNNIPRESFNTEPGENVSK